nr:hypothetical protein [Vibrio metschnikovii]
MNHEKLAHPKPPSTADTVTTVNSIDALAMVEHGSELTLSITTPVGTKFLCKTAFIGTHSDTYLLIETPKISTDDLSYYFQQGFSPLTGRICNLQRSIHHVRYGLKFDESGRERAKTLLGQLKFNGTKLMLTKSSQ